MQSFWMQMTDTAAVLELRDTPVPVAGPGQLLVRLRAASLNRGEFIAGHGLHGKPGTWKAIGQEGAGDVAAVGPDVTQFKPGDRVMGRCAGAFSEFALMEAAEAMTVPAGLSYENAASIPLVFLVTYDMLVLQGRLRAGETLLVTGVSSGVGVASLQLGKALGARVIGTSGSQQKLAALAPASDSMPASPPGHRTSRPGCSRPPAARVPTSPSTPSAARCSPRPCAPSPSKDGSRSSAMSMACCTRTSTSRPCTPSA